MRVRPDASAACSRQPRGLAWRCAGLLVAAGILVLGGCGSGAEPTADSGEIRIRVEPFNVIGQEDGAAYAGRAMAGSVAARLGEAPALRVTAPDGHGADSSDATPRWLLHGTLIREGGAARGRLALVDPDSRVPSWETEALSERGDLSELATMLARQAVEHLHVEVPALHEYIGDVTGGAEMAASPLAAKADSYWRRGDIDGFVETSAELVERFPDDPAAHVLHAWALVLAWDLEPTNETILSELRARLESLNRVDPASPYDELMRAFVYRSSGQPDQALILYSRVLGREDLSVAARAWVLRQRSFTQVQARNAEAARLDAERAVHLDPANSRSLEALSKAYETLKMLDESIACSRDSLALEPTSWRAFQRLGIVLAQAGRSDEAVEMCERACDIGRRQEACANLAVTLERTGREREARAAADDAASLAWSRWGAYNLACYEARAGHSGEALDRLRRAVELGYADALIMTDADLDILRGNPEFERIVEDIEDRLRSRQQLSNSVFPWQA